MTSHLSELLAHLTPARVSRFGALEWVDAIDSTHAELLRRGAAQADRAVLIADAQSAGRGRRGKAWHSPPEANLYLSMHARVGRSPQAVAGLSLVVGLATAEALHGLGHREVQVKWPNDLLARGRKLGGVLIELVGDAALIGLGLNLSMPAEATQAIDQPWIDLATLGGSDTRARVAASILIAWLDALDRFAQEGLPAFLARWDLHDALAGREVRVLAGSEQLFGRACGIAPDGGLRVRFAAGERIFHSADVSLRAA
jgi:BirA family biotin operon repressor/biotin-[acetyl-CoA-carboxylase] ligase